ncbi:MAG: peptidoglycan DD-metalloendopeptidase family protein [Bacteroidota bacterium]
MSRIIVTFIFLITAVVAIAQPQPSKEQQDLERERQQLKKELEQTQKLLKDNQKVTKENMSVLGIINRKLNIHENIVNNISREINLMDNNIYKSQRDINKLQLLLDTLKQEYARSMVYAYKNRSNSDFLNFIFSASSFNDAIKRINYLKSYRSYREMQGENIFRTQDLLKTRIGELTGSKKKKGEVLQVQSKEVGALAQQQEEKNKIVSKLKAEGKELNNQIAAKKKQMDKVNKAISAAINRAIKEANAEAAKRKKLADAEVAKNSGGTTAPKTKKVTKEPAKKQESVLLTSPEEVTLNASFERNRGNLPWPVSSGYLLLHYGPNKLESGIEVNSQGISIGCNVGSPVKAIFDGEVMLVNNYDDVQMIVIKHGRYFTGYSNMTDVSVSKGQNVKAGQVIGKSAANLDGVGALDMQISNDKNQDLNPEAWLKRR